MPAVRRSCIRELSCAIATSGSRRLLSARSTTASGTFALLARARGVQPSETRAARSCGPVITPRRPYDLHGVFQTGDCRTRVPKRWCAESKRHCSYIAERYATVPSLITN